MTDPGEMIDCHKYRAICSKGPGFVLQKVVSGGLLRTILSGQVVSGSTRVT
jgi:hypothetical protein